MVTSEIVRMDKFLGNYNSKVQIQENNKPSEIRSMAKSPLRYPGGKSRATNTIYKLIPKDTKVICSPFMGGGSLEITCANNGIKVYAYDIFAPLVEFWQCLLTNTNKLADSIQEYFPLEKGKFYKLQKTQRSFQSKYERAAVFYVLNRSSFSGSTMSGGMSPDHPRFTESSIERIRRFKVENLHVERLDFKKSISKHTKDLLYLDPPYLTKSTLYGRNGDAHKNFDHMGLAEMLKKREKWILSYNDSPEIHELYDSYTFHYPNWKYGMSNDKMSKEVLILSNDVAYAYNMAKEVFQKKSKTSNSTFQQLFENLKTLLKNFEEKNKGIKKSEYYELEQLNSKLDAISNEEIYHEFMKRKKAICEVFG
jgi:DNA adenine methylase